MDRKKDELEVPGINAVLEDLQKEHTRWQERQRRINALPLDQLTDDKRIQALYLESKLDYLELLIRRYTSWK